MNSPTPRHAAPTRPWLPAVIGAVIVATMMAIAANGARINPHTDGEWATLDALRGIRNRFLNAISHFVEVYIGPAWSPWIIVAIGLVLFLLKRRALALTVALMSGLNWLPGHFVKKSFPRERPDHLDAMTSYADGMSMPSGHTAIVMAVTVALCLYATIVGRHRRWVILGGVLFTLVVGFFRMYAAAHYPLDLLVGAGLALGTGLLLWWPAKTANEAIERRGGFWAVGAPPRHRELQS